MKTTLRQAYLAAFQILDEIFDETKNEKLGNFLSGMNPYLFSDSMSADPATWHEWTACAEKVSTDEMYENSDVLVIVNMFLQLNQKQYDFDMNWFAELLNKKIQDGRWEEIFQKAVTV